MHRSAHEDVVGMGRLTAGARSVRLSARLAAPASSTNDRSCPAKSHSMAGAFSLKPAQNRAYAGAMSPFFRFEYGLLPLCMHFDGNAGAYRGIQCRGATRGPYEQTFTARQPRRYLRRRARPARGRRRPGGVRGGDAPVQPGALPHRAGDPARRRRSRGRAPGSVSAGLPHHGQLPRRGAPLDLARARGGERGAHAPEETDAAQRHRPASAWRGGRGDQRNRGRRHGQTTGGRGASRRDEKAARGAHRRAAGRLPRGVHAARGGGVFGRGDRQHPADPRGDGALEILSRAQPAAGRLRLRGRPRVRGRLRLCRRALRPHRRTRDAAPERGDALMNMPVETLTDPLAAHARAMLEHLGEDPHRAGLADTPKRFAGAMRFLTSGYEAEPEDVVGSGIFEAEGEGVVLVRDIEFHSLCEHHMLPFFGKVHVAYLPGEKIIGLSKIPRIVDLYARRLQVQERISEQVADALMKLLEPRGVLVLAEARHLCMAMRGVEKQHSATATRALRGVYAHDAMARQEVLAMVRER